MRILHRPTASMRRAAVAAALVLLCLATAANAAVGQRRMLLEDPQPIGLSQSVAACLEKCQKDADAKGDLSACLDAASRVSSTPRYGGLDLGAVTGCSMRRPVVVELELCKAKCQSESIALDPTAAAATDAQPDANKGTAATDGNGTASPQPADLDSSSG